MNFINVDKNNKKEYNSVVNHPLQSFEWGEFREKTNVKVIRRALEKNGKIIDGFTITLHNVPKTNYMIGYLPKGNAPTMEILDEIKKIGKENNCIFIQLEPNIEKTEGLKLKDKSLIKSHHPLFTKYTFEIDLEKTEDELLKSFSSKTRYNIRLALKKEVKVTLDDSEKAFRKYLDLTNETTKRQGFYAHTPDYHSKMWETLKDKRSDLELSAHLLLATFKKEILTTWVLFKFKDTLYYPYGASTTKHKNLMANNLVMWEAIKFGKKMGLKKFDLWGALGPNASENDSWYGFHKFKLGYDPRHVEFVGSYDLVINPSLYNFYKVADKFRWGFLKLKSRFF